MLSIFFYVNKNIKNVNESIDFLSSKINNDVNLYVFFDDCDVVSNIDSNKCTIIKTNQTMGPSYFYNSYLNEIKTKYVWFIDGSCTFSNELNDIFSLLGNVNNDYLSFGSMEKTIINQNNFDKFNENIMPLIQNIFFSTFFLNTNSIRFTNNFFSLLFIYKVISRSNNGMILNKTIIKMNKNRGKIFDYNEIMSNINDFFINYSQSNFWNNNKKFNEAMVIYFLIYIYLFDVYNSPSNRFIKNIYLLAVKNFLNKNMDDWTDNDTYGKLFKKIELKDECIFQLINEWK